MNARPAPRVAVVFKTYAWDEFVQRQAARLEIASGNADFFIAVDETNGKVGPVPFRRVLRSTNAGLIAQGFADRFEVGSLLWWNPDYVHYDFRARHPDYDIYVFAEYDVTVQGSLDAMIEDAWARQIDFISMPIQNARTDWFWTIFHRQTYRLHELQGSLNCIALYSARALDTLAERRRAMAAEPGLRYWPSAEVFIATEIARAGYATARLQEYGNAAQYAAFPPILEGDVYAAQGPAFLHPVLDQPRLIASLLKSTDRTSSFLKRGSALRLALSRFPAAEYRPKLFAAARRRAMTNIANRLRRARLRLVPGALLPE